MRHADPALEGRALDYIRACGCRPPSFIELAHVLGHKTTRGAQRVVRILRDRGILEPKGAIRLTTQGALPVTKSRRFQHPMIFGDEHRPLTRLDFSIPKTPLCDVLDGYTELPDGSGWTALTVIDGVLHRLRGGGKEGPRSVCCTTNGHAPPGVWARNETTGAVSELVAKKQAPPGCSLDALDLLPYGYTVDSIPGWCGWGDEPSEPADFEMHPDPMEPTEP